jgi:CDP-diacylglycerol--glycerol-3-phosphate 3-phosphatidyltransferase
MTFTGLIGRICMFPLRLIIDACVRLRIHPNTLTFIGVLINFAAASALALGKFVTAGVIMVVANIFDFIDGKVANESNAVSAFGAFWDSVIDRFSDISLFIGLIFLYATLDRRDYVMVTALAMMFAIMTSYTRARAESLIKKCKVGFMERPERIVLLMVGAFTNRMAAVLWVILILSIFTVADRIILTYWTYDRATWQYDVMVIAILGFVWLTPPGWLKDPMASGGGPIAWLIDVLK